MIVDRVTPTRADLALDLMWRFMDLAEPVLNRVDDSTGSVGDVFRAACEDLGAIAGAAKPDPVDLAERVFAAVQANDYGVFDSLVTVMLPALGEAGAAHLKERLTKALMDQSGKGKRDYHARVVRSALQSLADGQSDVDAYIALVPPEERHMSYQGAEIGRRLLAAGRAVEALAVLERARPKRRAAKAAARDDDLYLVGEVYAEVGDGVTGGRWRIVGV